MNEKEHYEKQVRDYYSHLLNSFYDEKTIKEENFLSYDMNAIQKFLNDYIWEFSRSNDLQLFPINLFKTRSQIILGPENLFPIMQVDENTELKIIFAKPSILDKSSERLSNYQKSLDAYKYLEDKLIETEKVSYLMVNFKTPRVFLNKEFDGDILKAFVYDMNQPDSKFHLKFSVDKNNLSNAFDNPGTPLFYNIETKLELPTTNDWIKQIGSNYLGPEDKPFIFENDYDSTKNILGKDVGFSKSD
jgi:hypothetical protein